MKASIVIANFNNAKFINECISSLNSQTYKNIEIIFFDDNSKDNSIELVKNCNNVKDAPRNLLHGTVLNISVRLNLSM